MKLPPIQAKKNFTIPAKEEIIYDRYWITRLEIEGTPKEKVKLTAVFAPARTVTIQIPDPNDPNETVDFSYTDVYTNHSQTKKLFISDLLAEGENNPVIGGVVENVLETLIAIASAQQVI